MKILGIFFILLYSNIWGQGSRESDRMEDLSFQTSVGIELKYLLFVPENYNPDNTYPLVVSLHGLGDANVEYINAVNNFDQAHPWIEDSIQARVPHFIMLPQCPTGTWGGMGASTGSLSDAGKAVLETVEELKSNYSLDTNRFIITGFSIGGSGTYHLLEFAPDFWAAAVPTAAGGDSTKIELHAKTPIWHHHGSNDNNGGALVRMATALENHNYPVLRITSNSSINSPGAWRNALQGGTQPEDVIFNNSSPSYEEVNSAIEAGEKYLFLLLNGGDHGAGWINAAHNPLVAKWAFMQSKGDTTTSIGFSKQVTRQMQLINQISILNNNILIQNQHDVLGRWSFSPAINR